MMRKIFSLLLVLCLCGTLAACAAKLRSYRRGILLQTVGQMEKAIERARKQMQEAAKKLEFIEAAQYRDELLRLEDMLKERWG